MLSSILLGGLVNNFDLLKNNLAVLFTRGTLGIGADNIAQLTALVLIALFIRNIHGSVRYDDLITRTNLSPALEASLFGRFLIFIFSISALFLGPSLAGHYIVHHAVENVQLAVGTEVRLISGQTFTVILFLPFAVYFAWDCIMWVWESDGKVAESELDRTTYRWLVLDAIGIVLFLAMLVFDLLRRVHGRSFNYEIAALFFLLIGMVSIVGDYYFNREFYFPNERGAD
jgi:hypothetical protein